MSAPLSVTVCVCYFAGGGLQWRVDSWLGVLVFHQYQSATNFEHWPCLLKPPCQTARHCLKIETYTSWGRFDIWILIHKYYRHTCIFCKEIYEERSSVYLEYREQ